MMQRSDARIAVHQGHMDEERSALSLLISHLLLMCTLLFASLLHSFIKIPSALDVHEQLKLMNKTGIRRQFLKKWEVYFMPLSGLLCTCVSAVT